MCTGLSFSSINIKILGPNLLGEVADDLADLIDGDGDGKCREANGNFIPCPPKALVASVRELRQRLAALNNAPQWGEDRITRIIYKMRRGEHDFARNELDNLSSVIGNWERQARQNGQEVQSAGKPDSVPLAEKIKTKREKFKERIKKQRELGKKTASEKAQENYRALDIDYIKDLMEAGDDPNDLITKGIEQWAKGVLQHDITSRDGHNYESKVNQIYFTGDRIIMYGGIEDSNGDEIGRFERTLYLDKKHVYHNSFFMDADQQGNGVGSAFIQASEHLYRQAGFETVGVTGVSDSELNDEGNLSMTGATTWPQQGFNWKDRSQKAEFLRIIKDAVDEHADNNNYFADPQQADDLLAMVEKAEAQYLEDEDAIHPGTLLDWPGAALHFGEVGAQIGYLKKLDNN